VDKSHNRSFGKLKIGEVNDPGSLTKIKFFSRAEETRIRHDGQNRKGVHL